MPGVCLNRRPFPSDAGELQESGQCIPPGLNSQLFPIPFRPLDPILDQGQVEKPSALAAAKGHPPNYRIHHTALGRSALLHLFLLCLPRLFLDP